MYPIELRIREEIFFFLFCRWVVWCCATVHIIRSFPPSSIGVTGIQIKWSSERVNLDRGYSKCISFTNLSWACIVRNLSHRLRVGHSSRSGSTSWKKKSNITRRRRRWPPRILERKNLCTCNEVAVYMVAVHVQPAGTSRSYHSINIKLNIRTSNLWADFQWLLPSLYRVDTNLISGRCPLDLSDAKKIKMNMKGFRGINL